MKSETYLKGKDLVLNTRKSTMKFRNKEESEEGILNIRGKEGGKNEEEIRYLKRKSLYF